MATLLDLYWDNIIISIRDRVKKDGAADISSVIYSLKEKGDIPKDVGYTSEDLQIIIGRLTSFNEFKVDPFGDELSVKKNPTFELEKSAILANRSNLKLNQTLKWTNFFSILIANPTKIKESTKKKRVDKYDTKLSINGSFEGAIKCL